MTTIISLDVACIAIAVAALLSVCREIALVWGDVKIKSLDLEARRIDVEVANKQIEAQTIQAMTMKMAMEHNERPR